jgi:uncharacterized protein with GYD domain
MNTDKKKLEEIKISFSNFSKAVDFFIINQTDEKFKSVKETDEKFKSVKETFEIFKEKTSKFKELYNQELKNEKY